jgi:Macrocin-O-methyltransferase (TylF)
MKFAQEDLQYLTSRRVFSQSSGSRELWSVIDQWPLYCGIANLARSLAILDVFRSTLDVPGHVAEFGTWRGATLMLLSKALRIFDPSGAKVVHCFDSFEGLTEFSDQDGGATTMRGNYRGSLDEVQAMIELYNLKDEIVIHQGRIEETLPQFLDSDSSACFSFVYCDTDLYSSTRDILERLDPRLSVGGMFVLDEWNRADYPGETIAVREFISGHADRYRMEHVRNTRQPSLVLRKLR